MKKKYLKYIIGIIVLLIVTAALSIIILPESSARSRHIKNYKTVEDKILAEGEAAVIIRISDSATSDREARISSMRSPEPKKNSKIPGTIDITSEIPNFQKTNEFKIIGAQTGTLNKRGLKEFNALKSRLEEEGITIELYDDTVFKIHPDEMQPQSSTQLSEPDEGMNVNLDVSTLAVGANYSWNVLNITGRNITVAVIDTGIDYNHSSLGGCFNTSNGTPCRVADGWDYVNNDSDPMDDNGHGTHVAGIIGANGSVIGVAPEISFYALKACNAAGSCNSSSIIAAIDWAINRNADIISISIGGSYSDQVEGNTGKDITSLAIDNAVNNGIIVIVSAGNHGQGVSTINVPGAATSAITVGSADDHETINSSDDTIATTSSRGPGGFGRLDPDICAPGVGITSTYLNNGTQSISGTSMAAPHVTGATALLLEMNRSLTPSQVRAIILQSSVNIIGKTFDQGAGFLNIERSLRNNAYAIVSGQNAYSIQSENDRWEFVAYENITEANITIYNSNSYNLTFNNSAGLAGSAGRDGLLWNMENSITINLSANTTFLEMPEGIIVEAHSNKTIKINFSVTNYSGIYESTYGGSINLTGTFSNETDNVTVELSLPLIITMPFRKYAYETRNMTYSGASTGDVYYYAYYNPHSAESANQTITVNWSSSNNDFDIYLYNVSADLDNYGGYIGTDSESISSQVPGIIRWIRIHGYDFSGDVGFTINITDNSNHAPSLNITNSTQGTGFNATIGNNITINISYYDIDNDSLSLEFNDSRYTRSDYGENFSTYILQTNNSLPGNHTVFIKVTDDYNNAFSEIIYVYINSGISILNYSPSYNPTIGPNELINFTQESYDSDNRTLYYFWYIDGILNSTEQNISLNVSSFENSSINVTFIVSNNVSNQTHYWNLTIDRQPPVISSPLPNSSLSYSTTSATLNITTDENATCRYSGTNTSYNNMTYNFTDNATRHTASHSVSEGNSYTFYAKCSDIYNNTNNDSAVISFSVANAPADDDDDSGSSSGGSSSGGSSSGTYSSSSTISVTVISAESQISITANSNTIALTSMDISLARSQQNVLIKIVQHTTDVPEVVDKFETEIGNQYYRKEYKSFDITHDNLSDNNITDAAISFKVLKSWLTTNNLYIDDVVLYRYDREWMPLDTFYLKDDGTYYYYSSMSPGLSTFIIATKLLKNASYNNSSDTANNSINNTNTLNMTNAATDINQEENSSLNADSADVLGGVLVRKQAKEASLLISGNNSGNTISGLTKIEEGSNGVSTKGIILIIAIILSLSLTVYLTVNGKINLKTIGFKNRDDVSEEIKNKSGATSLLQLQQQQDKNKLNTIKEQYLREASMIISEFKTVSQNLKSNPNQLKNMQMQYQDRINELHKKYQEKITKTRC